MIEPIVFDNVMPDPAGYRETALASDFRAYEFSHEEVFRGIGLAGHLQAFPNWIASKFPSLQGKVSFFRQSPLGQEEPTYIHSDQGMGDWTAILYLNEDPPAGDGTTFWRHKGTGRVEIAPDFDGAADFKDLGKWEPWKHVQSAFNRVVMFRAPLFHSRGIFDNYGSGQEARLIQVIFGNGSLT